MIMQLHQAISQGILPVFWTTIAAAVASLVCCLLLPREKH
jgi:hypothetical protein